MGKLFLLQKRCLINILPVKLEVFNASPGPLKRNKNSIPQAGIGISPLCYDKGQALKR
jgi:hypothetical protein